MPNYVAIGQSTAEIWLFFSIFRDGGSRHLGSLKYRKFRGALLCQISRQSSLRPLRLGEEKTKKEEEDKNHRCKI